MKITWLDEDISPIDTPKGTVFRLYGVYDSITQHTTIYLIVDHRGTEYKIVRYHRPTTRGPNPEELKRRYTLTVQNFAMKYSHAPFAELAEKFIDWSDNPAHEVLRELIPHRALCIRHK